MHSLALRLSSFPATTIHCCSIQKAKRQMGEEFLDACRAGDLDAVQGIVERFFLKTEDVRSNDNDALRWACEKGHLNVAQWLVERFFLKTEDARSCDNEALR